MSKCFLFLLVCVCLSLTQPAASLAAVIINEVCWMGSVQSTGDEWIELYNSNAESIKIDGWILKTEDSGINIILKGEIPSMGFFLLERTDDNSVPNIKADLIYRGALSNTGEILKLLNANGNVVDEIDCQAGWNNGDNKTKQTMEKASGVKPVSGTDITPAVWQTSQEAGGTPKATNSQSTTSPVIPSPSEQYNTGDSSAAPPLQNNNEPSKPAAQPEIKLQVIEYPKSIFINEILPAPEGPDEQNEWIEIFNANNFTVNLAGWRVKDTVGAAKTHTLPQDSQIAANGFLLIPRTKSKITLQNNGDGLELYNPNGDLADQVIFPSAPNNQSYNRGPNPVRGEASNGANGWVWSSVLTPGAVNQIPPNPKQTNSAAIAKQGAISSTSSPDNAPSDIVLAGAQIGRFAPRTSRFLTFALAVAIAIASALVVLFLRKKQKEKV